MFREDECFRKAEGANQLGCDFSSVSCRREPALDEHDGDRIVPKAKLVELGWWFECEHCLVTVNSHTESPAYEGNRVFCSAQCVVARRGRVARQNERAAEFQARMRRDRPDLEWVEFRGAWPHLGLVADFRFPGCRFGGHVREEDGLLAWHVAHADVDAWAAHMRQVNPDASEVAKTHGDDA